MRDICCITGEMNKPHLMIVYCHCCKLLFCTLKRCNTLLGHCVTCKPFALYGHICCLSIQDLITSASLLVSFGSYKPTFHVVMVWVSYKLFQGIKVNGIHNVCIDLLVALVGSMYMCTTEGRQE